MLNNWTSILRAVEGSALWLLADNPFAVQNLKKEIQVRGIDPQRLVFAERMNLPEHLARHRVADLFIDTWPYSAHTTASDALWTGLPILTLIGESFASRVAASLLSAMGLPELITTTTEQFEALAIEFGKSPQKLQTIKNKIEFNRESAPLFDTPSYTKDIESVYLNIYQNYLESGFK